MPAKVYIHFFTNSDTPAQNWEKVRTTNFTTSKTKKNIEKVGDDHYIEKIYKSDQNVKKEKIRTSKSQRRKELITTTKITTSKRTSKVIICQKNTFDVVIILNVSVSVEDEDDKEVGDEEEADDEVADVVASSAPGSPRGGAQGKKNWLSFDSLMEETYPAKSKEVYLKAYKNFELYLKSAKEFVPDVAPTQTQLLNYFHHLKTVHFWQATSIWSQYSRLNGVLKRRFNLSLKEFPNLTNLLKSYEVGQRVTKATVFTPQQERVDL